MRKDVYVYKGNGFWQPLYMTLKWATSVADFRAGFTRVSKDLAPNQRQCFCLLKVKE